MDVRHRQTIAPGGRITTVQTLEVPPLNLPLTPETAEQAGRRYFDLMRRTFGGLITVHTREGGEVEIRFGPLTLLSFAPPRTAQSKEAIQVIYPIESGILVQPAYRQAGHLAVQLERTALTLIVDGYYGRLVGHRLHPLRKWFYLATQSALHRVLARRYLANLHRALQHQEEST